MVGKYNNSRYSNNNNQRSSYNRAYDADVRVRRYNLLLIVVLGGIFIVSMFYEVLSDQLTAFLPPVQIANLTSDLIINIIQMCIMGIFAKLVNANYSHRYYSGAADGSGYHGNSQTVEKREFVNNGAEGNTTFVTRKTKKNTGGKFDWNAVKNGKKGGRSK